MQQQCPAAIEIADRSEFVVHTQPATVVASPDVIGASTQSISLQNPLRMTIAVEIEQSHP